MRSSIIIESGELIIMVLRRLALGTSVGSFLGRKQTSLATLGVAAVSCACAATTTSTPPTMGRGRRFGGRQAAAMCTGSDSQRTSVHVALCQTKVTADKGLNIATAREAVRAAASKGAELIILPEIWNGPYATTAFPEYAESVPGGESTAMLSSVAKENKIWLIGGSVSERTADGRIYNTCAVFNPSGNLVAKHRKVHLFDIDVPGKITFKESDTLTGGDGITVFDTPFGRVGVGICYDIRFPELAQLMREKGAVILAYPGAFNLTTGPAHWLLLQQARAVDNQSYVLTASPARDPKSDGYQAWGHSTAVSPWGDVVATTDETPGTVHATLDLSRVAEIRSSIPIGTQKRKDLYNLQDISK